MDQIHIKSCLRRRDIENNRPLFLIKNINTDLSRHDLKLFQEDMIEVFSKINSKPSIIIPESEKNDKIKSIDNDNENDKSNFKFHIKQTIYSRPASYIVYKKEQGNEVHQKEYQANNHDYFCLRNYLSFKIGVLEFENIIITIENYVKGDDISEENAAYIIKKFFGGIEDDMIMKIAKYYKTRREIFKKPLLRKYWRENKNKDKYINTTFTKREITKMKIRRSNKQNSESLKDLKQIDYKQLPLLYKIFKTMLTLEKNKKLLMDIEQDNFIKEFYKIQHKEIPFELKNYIEINERSYLGYNFKYLNDINYNINKNINISNNINKNDGQEIIDLDYEKKNYRNKKIKIINDSMSESNKSTTSNEYNKKNKSRDYIDITSNKSNKDDDVSCDLNIDIDIDDLNNETINTHKKNNYNKNNILNNDDSYPKKESKKTKIKKVKVLIKNTNIYSLINRNNIPNNTCNNGKIRVRLNRVGNIVIDRYIQKKESMNPFDDSLSKNILKYKKYNGDLTMNANNKDKFCSFYDQFLCKKFNYQSANDIFEGDNDNNNDISETSFYMSNDNENNFLHISDSKDRDCYFIQRKRGRQPQEFDD